MEQQSEPDTGPAGTGQGEAEGREDPPTTGEPRVDAAIRRLSELDDLPVSEHPEVFERIHGQLVDVLGELHYGPEAPEPAGSAGQG